MKDSTNVRRAAYDSLYAIEKCGRYSNLEVDAALKRNNDLGRADRTLYTRLVYGVIEKKLTLDEIISQYSSKHPTEIDLETLISLRLGIYQLVFTDKIPDFAAVSESVDTAPRRSRGFVNAVLRSFLRAEKRYTLPEGRDPESMSVRYSVSPDIAETFLASYGEAACDILASLNEERGVALRVNTLKGTLDEVTSSLEAAGDVPTRATYCADVIRIPTVSEAVREGIACGRYFVQDEASRICSTVLGAEAGDVVADTCAAPGGKSFSLAIDMKNEGRLYSFDLHKNKISLINSGAERLGITIINTEARDARRPSEELFGACDKVLCDAPCSGLGVIAKKPEIRYKGQSDYERLPQIQADVLEGAAKYVKDGGTLVYSTCTLNKKENEDVVTAFLKAHLEFVPCEFTVCSLDGTRVLESAGGMLTFLPHITGTDGFFVAKMRRGGCADE